MPDIKVLAVDDRPENLLSLEELLTRPGVEVIRATSGNDALGLTFDHDFALILMDVQMPGMDGFETAELLRGHARTRSIPIIFVTAESRERHHVFKGYDSGAVDYLLKPLDPRLIKSKVEVFLELERQKQELRAKTEELNAKLVELEELQQELQHKNEQLRLLSSQDGLTGLVNRRRFDEILENEWQRAMRSGKAISLVLSDVDCFKSFNDNYGHVAGDECLRQVARAMGAAVRRHVDTLARYGGEEFAAVLPETDREGAVKVAQLMREAVAALDIPHAYSSAARHVTMSFGLCTMVPAHGQPRVVLVEAADKSLYQAKLAGRDCCRVCEDPPRNGDGE
jgi:diguanylate cyclase (GGDEF)-like protein